MNSRGHVPQRMCAGCGRRLPKGSLVRFVVEAGRVILDPRGNREGRGAYICPRLECFEEACGRRKSLQRKLGASLLGQNLREEFSLLIDAR